MKFEIETGIPAPIGRTPRKLAKFCRRGHERTPENVNNSGNCKICRLLKEQALYTSLEYREYKNEKRRVKVKKERKQTHCKNGHELTAENRYANGKCILCARLRSALRCIEKPEIKREESRRYYFNNKERVSERVKDWKLKNLEKFKEYAKTWQSENRDKTRAYSRKFDAKYPEKAITRHHRRRARKLNQFVANVDRFEIFKRDWHTCMICNKPLDMTAKWPNPMSPSIDHIVAIANGGTHEPANVQAAHLGCNMSKGNRY